MHTIPVPEHPWGAIEPALPKFLPKRAAGKRVPGWEDVNVTRLASEIGVSFRYLLAVLCGQRNCTLALLQRTAQALGISLVALIDRMEHAYYLRLAVVPKSKSELRRKQSERRSIVWNRQSAR